MADGPTGQARPLTWERLEPGHFHATTALTPGSWLRGAVQVGQYAVPFGPVAAGTDPEWTFDPQRVKELQNVARFSGGGERIDLSKVWQAPRREEFAGVRPWLLTALLLVFVLEALCTRLGWRLPRLGAVSMAMPRVPRPSWRKPTPRPSPNLPTAAPIPVAPVSVPAASTTAAQDQVRAERFRRAKSGPGS